MKQRMAVNRGSTPLGSFKLAVPLRWRLLPAMLLLAVLMVGVASQAMATIYYVDSSRADDSGNGQSWGAAEKTIDAALTDATTAGDEIWVKAGTYVPTSAAGFTPSVAVKIYGGFAGTESATGQRLVSQHPTILNGDINGDDTANFGNRGDNAGPVVSIAVANMYLDGLIIRGGNGTSAQLSSGGIYANSANNCVVSNCVFVDNSSVDGGAITVRKCVNFQIRNCVFSGNRATQSTSGSGGGGAVAYGFNPGAYSVYFDRCVFSGNTCSSGGDGGAVQHYGQTTPWSAGFTNCLVVGNTSGGNGGGIVHSVSLACRARLELHLERQFPVGNHGERHYHCFA